MRQEAPRYRFTASLLYMGKRAGVAAKKPTQRRAVQAGPSPIYVLSDSTGNLGRHILTALLTQFPPDAFRLEMRSFLRTPQQIADVGGRRVMWGNVRNVFYAWAGEDRDRVV